MDANNEKQQHEDKSEGIETTVEVVGSVLDALVDSSGDVIGSTIEIIGEVLSGLS